MKNVLCKLYAGETVADLSGVAAFIYDLAGNLAEWVADGLVQPPPGGLDPLGNPAAPLRVIRGASFYDGADKLAATYRNGVAPVTAHATIGFRCAMDSGESPAAPDAGPGKGPGGE